MHAWDVRIAPTTTHVAVASVEPQLNTLDIFVFTLGLTEAWESRIDGAVFPFDDRARAAEEIIRRMHYTDPSVQTEDSTS